MGYEVGQTVTVRVERVLPFGVLVRLPDGTPGYIRGREMRVGGHWDPAKMLAVDQQVAAVVVALPTAGQVIELTLKPGR